MIFTNLLPLTGLLTLALPLIRAQNDSFIPFDDFIQGVQDATYAEWNATAVESSTAFDEIKAHILTMYNGIGQISNTFVLDVEYADCVDIDKQPTVRLLGVDYIRTPASYTSFPETKGEGHVSNYAESPLKLGLTDRFGNRISCPEGTIPFARLTLQKLTRFPNLRAFFHKPPPPTSLTHPSRRYQRELFRRDNEPHLHAIGYEYVKNFGGDSWLNLWNPVGDFSLSQQWYIGGSGTHLQTVEGGWVNYEQKFHTTQSVLFIFYTPDNYTSGCWNLDCTGFVQTNNNWFLGGIWNHYSVSGGAQWGFEMQWKMYQKTWYLFLKGPGDYELVGHYPPGIFGAGQLTKNAELIEYGGEVTRFDPSHNWPQMGSGVLPSAGWTKAAFQKSIFYIPKNQNGGVGVWTSLTPLVEGFKKCWDIIYTPSANGGNWGSYFYFGGPGGKVCN